MSKKIKIRARQRAMKDCCKMIKEKVNVIETYVFYNNQLQDVIDKEDEDNDEEYYYLSELCHNFEMLIITITLKEKGYYSDINGCWKKCSKDELPGEKRFE